MSCKREGDDGPHVEIMGLSVRSDFDDGLVRVRDIELGIALGMAQPRDIRRTIEAHAKDLKDFGNLLDMRAPDARPQPGNVRVREYWLTRNQAIYVASLSGTELGRKTLKLLVMAFDEYERTLRDGGPARVPFLAATYSPWSKRWRDDLMVSLCRLRGELFMAGGRHPRWAARINATIYEALLGKEGYAELKRRNPHPARGHNHHQLISPELIERFDQNLALIKALADVCGSMDELTDKVRHLFLREPMQLSLMASSGKKGRR